MLACYIHTTSILHESLLVLPRKTSHGVKAFNLSSLACMLCIHAYMHLERKYVKKGKYGNLYSLSTERSEREEEILIPKRDPCP